MERAARVPSATASTTVAPPFTMSPAAKTPGREDWGTRGLGINDQISKSLNPSIDTTRPLGENEVVPLEVRMWRNWQTRMVQVHVLARAW
ncbi:MAG: hypothetical protein H6Q86_1303, partial [candidate division NC10 bacterium]|nr:hypothetical protein [candidate division NC10 bacterium]